MLKNKFIKGCLLFIGILILIVSILIVLFFIRANNNRKQAKIDNKKYAITCNNTHLIVGEIDVKFSEFKISEIDTLYFKIIRNNKKVRDTLLTKKSYNYISENETYTALSIPFKKFYKTDTIVITTKQNLKYYISDFSYYAYLHYGMFGYLGSYDCRLSNRYAINNTKNINTVNKFAGWTYLEKSKKQFIPSAHYLFDSISNALNIDEKKADKIIEENTINPKYKYYNIMLGIQKNEDSIFYLFKQKVDDFTFKYAKINSQTGKYYLQKEN